MIKSHVEKITKSETVIDEVICNCCGESIRELDQNSDYLHIEKDWGYFSAYDMENHKFDLCNTCYIRIINMFKIPVTTRTNIF